jgi:two-component system cell cycle response regulator
VHQKSDTQAFDLFDTDTRDPELRTPVLVVIQGEEIGRRIPLSGAEHVLGRSEEHADLCIADRTVSSRHARIERDPTTGGYRLYDLGSRNGTFVNRFSVESVALHDGDKIFLGQTVLKFTFHDPIEASFHGELERRMHVDSLSGLYGRRWFDQEYPKAVLRARSEGRPLCVLMMDMDGLKPINERHGHQMGSHCIAEAGRLILRVLPASAAGARFGGDEFVVWMGDCDLDDALDVGESIRRRVSSHDFGVGLVRPTLSIGVAALEGQESAEQLLRRADEALYRAKKSGRNRVCD